MGKWCSIESSERGNLLRLRGAWRIAHLPEIEAELSSHSPARGEWAVDGEALDELDTAAAMLVVRYLQNADSVQLLNFTEPQNNVFKLVHQSVAPSLALRRKDHLGFVAEVGRGTLALLATIHSLLQFIGQTALELAVSLIQPHRIRWKELAVQLELSGLNAVPIVILVTFLIGIVIAYLTGIQLEYYGATVFVVDGIGIATVRELSPILVAIIVAGRSGSAFTAQIGSMKINEEVDAISTLGLSPHRVLVIPRLLALIIAMPILVVIGDIAGIFGGLMVADLRLGVSGPVFLERLQSTLALKHIFAGLVKAPVFAFFVATIGCRMGLNVENNARSVGMNTTATVVRSIVVVILLNAAFAVIFTELGI